MRSRNRLTIFAASVVFATVDQGGPTAAFPGRHQEARGGAAEQQGQRVGGNRHADTGSHPPGGCPFSL